MFSIMFQSLLTSFLLPLSLLLYYYLSLLLFKCAKSLSHLPRSLGLGRQPFAACFRELRSFATDPKTKQNVYLDVYVLQWICRYISMGVYGGHTHVYTYVCICIQSPLRAVPLSSGPSAATPVPPFQGPPCARGAKRSRTFSLISLEA